MSDRKHLKHQVLEMMEGGLWGSAAARVFNWTALILIVLSVAFMFIGRLEGIAPGLRTLFKVVEIATIALFTAEVILGFWTADVRFPEDAHPRLTYLKQWMTIVEILAILPFYTGLVLRDPVFEEFMEVMELLHLLHLLKAAEIIRISRKKET